jgi:hypothetical protein
MQIRTRKRAGAVIRTSPFVFEGGIQISGASPHIAGFVQDYEAKHSRENNQDAGEE